MKFRRVSAGVAIFVLCAAGAWAGPVESSGNGLLALPAAFLGAEHGAVIAPINDPFDRDSILLHAYGSAAFGDERGAFYQAHVGAAWYFWDDLAFGMEGVGGMFRTSEAQSENTALGGLNLFLRWHFFHEDRWSVYMELYGGFILASHSPTDVGTNFNFTPSAGFGATYQLSDRLLLMGGARWLHMSNRDIEGPERNPGMDQAMVYLGAMMPF